MYLVIPCPLSITNKVPAVARHNSKILHKWPPTRNSNLLLNAITLLLLLLIFEKLLALSFSLCSADEIQSFLHGLKWISLFLLLCNPKRAYPLLGDARVHNFVPRGQNYPVLNESSVRQRRNIGHSLNSLFNSDFNSIGSENPEIAQQEKQRLLVAKNIIQENPFIF